MAPAKSRITRAAAMMDIGKMTLLVVKVPWSTWMDQSMKETGKRDRWAQGVASQFLFVCL